MDAKKLHSWFAFAHDNKGGRFVDRERNNTYWFSISPSGPSYWVRKGKKRERAFATIESAVKYAVS
jgi:hypothetical protein